MEIKQGDKVRVSKDAPKVYLSSANNLFKYHVCKVEETDGDSAKIRYTDIGIDRWLAIPTKYLVKVGGEYKPKFKKGDKVRFKKVYTVVSVDDGQVFIDSAGNHIDEDCLELYTEPTAPTIKVGDRVRNIESGLIGVVDKIVYGNAVWVNGVDGKRYHWKSDELELIEPTEQTEAEEDARIRQIEAELDEFRKAELDRMLHPEKYHTYEVTIDNVVMNWQRYEADLAKEVALKVANKYNDPEQAAEYAVSVTKAVVEGLKWK